MSVADLGAMTPEEYRYHRDRLGLSQEALARRLGISTSTVQKREAGSSPIDYEAAVAISSLEPEPAA